MILSQAVIEAINEVKRDSVASERLTQPRQARLDPDYEENGVISKERVKLEDTVYGKFIASGFNGTWVSGNEVRTRVSDHLTCVYTLLSLTPDHVHGFPHRTATAQH